MSNHRFGSLKSSIIVGERRMSILLLSVCDHPYHDRFLFGVIASATSACDFLLFVGMLRHPFFLCYNSYVLMCDSNAQAFAKRQESGRCHFFCYNVYVIMLGI